MDGKHFIDVIVEFLYFDSRAAIQCLLGVRRGNLGHEERLQRESTGEALAMSGSDNRFWPGELVSQ